MLSTNRFRSITLQCLHQEFFVRAGKNRDNWKALRSVKEIRQCLFLFKRCKEFWNIAFTANKTWLRLINCNSAAGYILLGTQHFLVFQHLVSDHIVSSATSYLFRVILYDAGVQIKTSLYLTFQPSLQTVSLREKILHFSAVILDSTGFIVKSYNIYTDFVEIESS